MKASPILANVSPVVASPVVASPLVPCFPDRLGKTEATKGQRATKGQYLLSTYRPLVAPRGVTPLNSVFDAHFVGLFRFFVERLIFLSTLSNQSLFEKFEKFRL